MGNPMNAKDVAGPLQKRVSKALKRWRLARELSQKALCEKTGLCIGYVSMMERELRMPSLPVLVGISRALRVDAGSILRGELPVITEQEPAPEVTP